MAEQALSDVKVLDLTLYIAGPYCTKLLADYGADVIKVERPGGGDPARHLGPFLGDDPHPEKSGLFLHLNTNKRGITLNLKSDTGVKIFKELVKGVDILVEGFRPGVMERLGLGYEELEKINPRLVMTSISNFGQTGPYRDYKASDIILYGMGGGMYDTGIPEREPLKKGGTVIQFQGGNHAAAATMVALFISRLQGIGQQVDISLFQTQIASPDRRMSCLIGFQYNKEITPRLGGRALGFPYGSYPCKDGYFDLIGGLSFWPRIPRMLGMPELLTDPRFAIGEGQSKGENREAFDAIFLPWLMQRTKKECVEEGQAVGVLCATVCNMEDLLGDPHWKARGFWVDIEHSVAGNLTYPGAPFKMGEGGWEIRRPAPLLGQHNEEVYAALGYTREDLVKLRERGVI